MGVWEALDYLNTPVDDSDPDMDLSQIEHNLEPAAVGRDGRYPIHREGAYEYLMDNKDREMFTWVRQFNRYDLHSKSDSELVSEYFPREIAW